MKHTAERKATIKRLFGWIIIAAGSAAALVIRLLNPDMAEMRLFLNYWYIWLFVAGCCYFGVWLLDGDLK